MNKPKRPSNTRKGPRSSNNRGHPRKPAKPAPQPSNLKRSTEELVFVDDASTAVKRQRLAKQAPKQLKKPKKPPKPEPPPIVKAAKIIPPIEPGRTPKAFEIKHGEYFDQNSSDDDHGPIDQITLPRSLVEEDEEKDLRKRFGKNVVDVYSSERNALVKVRKDQDQEETERRSSGSGWGPMGVKILLVVVVMMGLTISGIYVFRDELRPTFKSWGFELPK